MNRLIILFLVMMISGCGEDVYKSYYALKGVTDFDYEGKENKRSLTFLVQERVYRESGFTDAEHYLPLISSEIKDSLNFHIYSISLDDLSIKGVVSKSFSLSDLKMEPHNHWIDKGELITCKNDDYLYLKIENDYWKFVKTDENKYSLTQVDGCLPINLIRHPYSGNDYKFYIKKPLLNEKIEVYIEIQTGNFNITKHKLKRG